MSGARPPLRVFLSHTGELRRHPVGKSFVAAAESAIARARDAVVEMAYFAARALPPAEVCLDMVGGSDVFVVIVGFQYGSPVPDRPDVSYTELEHETAERIGLPRLIFFLAEDAELPTSMLLDLEHGNRQEGFRRRLADSGVTTATVSSPDQLETALLHALLTLPRPEPQPLKSTAPGMAPIRRLWTIPARIRQFIGRSRLLEELETAFKRGKPNVVLALSGIAGIGKTTTVIEYAHRYRSQFDIAWWVPAEDPTLIPERLAELAAALGLTTSADPAAVGVARLRADLAQRERWLVVFDNSEDPRALTPFLPDGPGQVLITSRNPAWGQVATAVEVAEFNRAEAVALLLALVPQLCDADADRVAAALGDLPLAMNQAGGLLADSHLSPDVYLQLLQERAEDLLDNSSDGAYPHSLAASWAVTFDRLAADNPAALDLLTVMAWCGPEQVPLWLVAEHPELLPDRLAEVVADALALSRCTSILRRRGLASVSPHNLLLHRVPAALLRTRTRDTGPANGGWAAVVVRLLQAAKPDTVWNTPAAWPRCRQLLPHVLAATDTSRALDAVLDHVSELLIFAATYMQTRGEPREALSLVNRAYQADRARLGDDHPHTLSSAHIVARVLLDLGEYRDACTLNEHTFSHRRRILGDNDPKTLNSANNLARTLRALGEEAQARALLEDTLSRRRRTLGDDHHDTLTSAHNLAAAIRAIGDYKRARELFEDTLNRRRRTLGDDNPATLTSANNLAAVLRALGEHKQALILSEDVLTRRRRILGNDHPATLTSANNLARTFRAIGNYAKARELDEDTLRRRRNVLGEDHRDTRGSARTLAADLRALGEIPDSER